MIETELFIDEKSGRIISQSDCFRECTDVVCGECNARPNDKNVLNMGMGDQSEF